jgi:hypothetical protein
MPTAFVENVGRSSCIVNTDVNVRLQCMQANITYLEQQRDEVSEQLYQYKEKDRSQILQLKSLEQTKVELTTKSSQLKEELVIYKCCAYSEKYLIILIFF